MDTLTHSEEELVDQFVSITNYPGPPHTAIPYLQASDWNLERAIIMYFESSPAANEQLNSSAHSVIFPGNFPGDDTMTDEQQRPRSSDSQTPRSNAVSDFFDTVKRILTSLGGSSGYIPLSSGGNTSGFASTETFFELSPKSKAVYIVQILLYVPMFALHKATIVIFYVLSKLFPFFKRLTDRYSQNRHGSRSEPRGVDPAQIARNFTSDFNLFYRNDNRLSFFEGGYTSALYIAKRDARFLAVYLHSEENDDTRHFVQETLLDERVLKFFQEHNLLVWGGNVVESEAYQVSNVLGATKYPFIALLALKTSTQETPEGTTTGSPTMSIVSRINGSVTPEKLIDKFSSQVERLEPSLIAVRTDRQEMALARVIREQQDQAYQTSLQRDREIAEQRRRQRELHQKREQWLIWRSSTISPEVPMENKGQYARVAIRMSNGERVSRRFDKDVAIEEIYAFVELYQKGLLQVSERADKPENFVYEFPFKLISPMPRQELSPSLDVKVQDESIVWPNGNLIVETNDDDED